MPPSPTVSSDSPANETSRVIIVVPCYNEAERLPVDTFRTFAAEHPSIRFLLVNDGSKDNTREVIETLAADMPEHFAALSLDKNSGKAEAVRQGFLKAFEDQPTYVGFWDADLATPLPEIPVFQSILDQRDELEIIFGARVNLLGRDVRRKATRHYLGRVFATAAVMVVGIPIYDTQCGAKLFRVKPEITMLFDEPFISKWVFDVEIIARMVHHRRNSDAPQPQDVIYEQPLDAWHDIAGSKLKTKDFLVVGCDLWRIYFRYMRS
jgi:dolichyl-phosphate beta-glucosyltransferase